jgi:isopenicillin-N epimerase
VPPAPLAENMIAKWMLDPSVTFLNHGCFGARPRVVSDAQQRWRHRLEARPVELLDRWRDDLLDEAKRSVGQFVGASSRNFGFVTNATGGVCAVLRSLRFQPGDELLTIDHVYNAVRMAMRMVAGHSGAGVIELPLPLPLRSPDEIVDAIAAAITKRTRLLIIDHITSPTAVLMPVQRLLDLCADREVDVLVDGAHAPGMVDLNVEALGAAYYTGNLHKWACAPMGAAFLWVRPDRQSGIHPLTISHFFEQGFAAELSWQGTRDITPWLCAADAIGFMDGIGWERVRRHNHDMALWMQAMLCDRWGVESATPLDGSMIGSMATVPLPPGVTGRFDSAQALQARLYDEHRIEAPVIEWPVNAIDGEKPRWWIRPSCQVYNTAEDYERLADAVLKMQGHPARDR